MRPDVACVGRVVWGVGVGLHGSVVRVSRSLKSRGRGPLAVPVRVCRADVSQTGAGMERNVFCFGGN